MGEKEGEWRGKVEGEDDEEEERRWRRWGKTRGQAYL